MERGRSGQVIDPTVDGVHGSLIPHDAIFSSDGAAASGDVADPAPPRVHQVRCHAVGRLDMIDVDVARGSVGTAVGSDPLYGTV